MSGTEQLVWGVLVGLAVAATAFLVWILWLPGDRRAERGPKAAGKDHGSPAAVRPIATMADVIAFFRERTGDAALAAILADAAEAHGKDGCVEVRRGGDGSPYSADFVHRPEEEVAADTRSFAEVKAEVEGLREQLTRAATDDERDALERQIAWLAGGICILWINVATASEYQQRRHLVRESVAAFKRACSAGQA